MHNKNILTSHMKSFRIQHKGFSVLRDFRILTGEVMADGTQGASSDIRCCKLQFQGLNSLCFTF